MNSNELDVLVKTSLNAVVFVMDYLQIQFDIATLTFVKFPEVSSAGRLYAFGERDYRNALCSFIGENVSSVEFFEDRIFCLKFRAGTLSISLSPENYISPEMVVIDLREKSISF